MTENEIRERAAVIGDRCRSCSLFRQTPWLGRRCDSQIGDLNDPALYWWPSTLSQFAEDTTQFFADDRPKVASQGPCHGYERAKP